jgi:hypothetical protein
MGDNFTFAISLSVLNHLGRNLYRSFATVLGEAISNAWDANAENVFVYIDKEKNSFYIKDDGMGMTADDFQGKFLKIGYSKRKEGNISPGKKRPYIGRKGIGKLALLSCAEKITVISKKDGDEYVGGVIDNSGLTHAITHDLTPDEYPLGTASLDTFGQLTDGHEHGTIIYFENLNEGIRHSLGFLKKIIALYFRFSLIDETFMMFIDDEPITIECLSELASKTEFLWEINTIEDPYIAMLSKCKDENDELSLKEGRRLTVGGDVNGFIASVKKPRDLAIFSTGERVGIDLFVNGRLREKDILKHKPTARIVESYLYGQIHFNDLDDEVDRFTSSREGIIADDPKFEVLLQFLQEKVISIILEEWDAWRRKHKKDGDADNESIPKKVRRAEELFIAVSEEYELPKGSGNKQKVEDWVAGLSDDAKYNFTSYAECFISENLLRKYIRENKMELTPDVAGEIEDWIGQETKNKAAGNVNIDLRQGDIELSYLDMKNLSKFVDATGVQNALHNDSKEYKPIRDALMHTALLTDEAKRRLTTVYENIKARVIKLLSAE